MKPEALAALHAVAFPGPPRAWTATEFSDLLADPRVLLLTEDDRAFVLARLAGPEAEVLTICTDPTARKRGLARRLLARLERELGDRGVEDLFLEVAETNHAARALYAAAGFAEKGYRKDYYTGEGAQKVHARVLAKPITGQPGLP